MQNKRINNISFEEHTNSKGENYIHILRYYPNDLYQKKDEYIKNGYIEKNGFLSFERSNISLSLFDVSECCYAIAEVCVDFREPDIYLKTVGSRLLELPKEEINDFFEVYRIADTYLKEKYLKSEDDE